MIDLPGDYLNADEYAENLMEFINTPLVQQITGGIHVNDALIYNAWEALPPEWTSWWSSLPDHRLAQQDLIDSIDESTDTTTTKVNDRKLKPIPGRPDSLKTWLEIIRSLSLPRTQRAVPRISLPEVLTARMKTKKIDEVSIATAYIQGVCQANNITRIIDMGSGQGYLSVSLAYLYPNLHVLAIDGSESQIAASTSCAASLGIEDRIQHLLRYIDGTGPLADEIAAWAGGEKCMLVGLHACGNLSEHMLRYFTTIPFIEVLGAVGCCYNHIVPLSDSCPNGFPISAKMKDRKLTLSATALMTGCQAPNNWEKADPSKEESVYSKRRFYRALLEKVFFDNSIELDKQDRPVWGVRKGDMVSFTKFASRAMHCLGIEKSDISDAELLEYEARYGDCEGKVAILWTLSVLCCKVVESVIALDRYWFLVENGAQNVDVLPIFDYKISPRNLMLVADKGSYKLRVLLFDLRNLAKDVNSAKRLNSTTDEHYISEPYFEPEQAKVVKSAIVDVEFNNHLDPNAEHEEPVTDEPQPNDIEMGESAVSRVRGQTVDTAIRMIMDNFLEKRKSSGDARPCGPHDLAPVYLGLFGMTVPTYKTTNS
ncbi:Protein RRNAD1 [Colletotrichum sp. SAR 10_96]|nr:Protein RRNAD1 [Colletotrichum sp. SAR 10_96]